MRGLLTGLLGWGINREIRSEETLLHQAASSCFKDVDCAVRLIHLLLDHGPDVNARNDRGFTPLMEAAFRGYCSVPAVRALLERGADPNVRCCVDSTHEVTLLAIIEATPSLRRGSKTLVNVLKAAGATR